MWEQTARGCSTDPKLRDWAAGVDKIPVPKVFLTNNWEIKNFFLHFPLHVLDTKNVALPATYVGFGPPPPSCRTEPVKIAHAAGMDIVS